MLYSGLRIIYILFFYSNSSEPSSPLSPSSLKSLTLHNLDASSLLLWMTFLKLDQPSNLQSLTLDDVVLNDESINSIQTLITSSLTSLNLQDIKRIEDGG